MARTHAPRAFARRPKATDLACLVYTSGTTGTRSVMLTHRNILSNIRGVLRSLNPNENEVLLSFLPLSHTFERTTSYYLSLGLGCTTPSTARSRISPKT